MSDQSFIVKHAFPAFRVFIYGVEITDDVVTVATNRTTGATPGTATITLSSPEDKYLVTHDDIVRIIKQRNNVDISSIPNNTVASAVNSMTTGVTTNDINEFKWGTYGVITTKLSVKVTLHPLQVLNEPAAMAPSYRYPFECGRCVFHPMDPVRIAFRDPFNLTDWYWMFSGVISDTSDTFDANHARVVSITAEDPRKLLRYSRFTINSGFVDIADQKIYQQITAPDVASKSGFTNAFPDATIQEIFYSMIFGINAFKEDTIQSYASDGSITTGRTPQTTYLPQTSISANGSASVMMPTYGCGHPNITGSCAYILGNPGNDKSSSQSQVIPPQPVQTLGQYQQRVDSKVSLTDRTDMLGNGAKDLGGRIGLNTSTPTVYDVITLIGSRPDLYPVDGGRLIMLLPANFGVNNRFVTIKDFSTRAFALNTEWSNRLDVLAEVVDYIQFAFYVSPRGDWIVEFPLFDYSPQDFQLSVTPEPYVNRYNVALEDTYDISCTFTDSKINTQVVSTWSIFQGWTLGNNTQKEINSQRFVTLTHMIPLYGVRQMPLTPRAYVATPEGAILYNTITLNRCNADAYQQTVNMNPNVGLELNRPVLVNVRDHVGTISSITQTISWGLSGDASTQISLYGLRGWDGTTVDGRKIYTPLGGVASQPLNYARLFAPAPKTTTQP